MGSMGFSWELTKRVLDECRRHSIHLVLGRLRILSRRRNAGLTLLGLLRFFHGRLLRFVILLLLDFLTVIRLVHGCLQSGIGEGDNRNRMVSIMRAACVLLDRA